MKVSVYFLCTLLSFGAASCGTTHTAATQPMPQARPQPQVIGAGTFTAPGGQTIRATYFDNARVILLFADGSTKTLQQAPSGSGSRYVSGDLEWWEHHGEASYSVNGKQVFQGNLAP